MSSTITELSYIVYVLHAMCVVANTGVLLDIYGKYYNRTVQHSIRVMCL